MNIQQIRSDAAKIQKSGYVRTDGGVVVKSPFNAEFVAAIKSLPKADRFFDSPTAWEKFWFISDASADKAIALYEKFFSISSHTHQPGRTTERKVKYCPDCGRVMDEGFYCEHCEG